MAGRIARLALQPARWRGVARGLARRLARRLPAALQARTQVLAAMRVVLDTGVLRPQAVPLCAGSGIVPAHEFGSANRTGLNVFMLRVLCQAAGSVAAGPQWRPTQGQPR